MTCKHTPRFNFKVLFARKPEYVCRRCGVPLEMTSGTRTASRTLNSLLVAAMIFKVFRGSSQTASLQAMAMDIGVLLLYILIYFVAYFLMLQFGKFTEKIMPEELEKPESPAETTAPAQPVNPTATANGDKTQAYTQEQLDLMALYKSYAKDEPNETTAGNQTISTSAAAGSQAVSSAVPQIPDQECAHEPVKNWKNYIPTNFNFVCAKCGQPITLTARSKKSVNIAIMAVILVILMPSFMNNSVNSLEYAGLTLVAFLVATLIQYIYLRKAQFEIRTIAPASTPKSNRKSNRKR